MKNLLSRMLAITCFFFAALPAFSAFAAEPILRVEATPRAAILGEPVRLRVSILVPNWFAKPPAFPALDLRGAVVRVPPDAAFNLSEGIGGEDYVGIARDYYVFPQVPGILTLPGAGLSVTYVETPPTGLRTVRLTLPAISVLAYRPDDGALEPFFSASDLEMEERFDPPPDDLKVGDAFRRLITIRAAGATAMLIPQLSFGAAKGLGVYPSEARLEDVSAGRGEIGAGLRIEEAAYSASEAGEYVLPPVALRWWNRERGRVEESVLPARRIRVAPAPLRASSGDDARALHWLRAHARDAMLAGAVLGLGVFVFVRRARLRRHLSALLRVAANAGFIRFLLFFLACAGGDPRSALHACARWEAAWARRALPAEPARKYRELRAAISACVYGEAAPPLHMRRFLGRFLLAALKLRIAFLAQRWRFWRRRAHLAPLNPRKELPSSAPPPAA
ncbi:MAG: hypothetical protein K9G30_08745 [Parvibaculum sp.]|nr:hypothetical protein [Parvibaculum sp.]